MKAKGDTSVVILGVTAIIAIVIMVLLVKSVSTGNVSLGKLGPEFTIAKSCGKLPKADLTLSARECRNTGYEECRAIYGNQYAAYGSNMCFTECMKHIANLCRDASRGIPLY